MASINRIEEGQTLWEVVSQKAGNTSIRTKVVYAIKVIEVDLEEKKVLASWNGNPARTYRERQFAKWRVKKPVIENRWGF